jgi:hypothetical protein
MRYKSITNIEQMGIDELKTPRADWLGNLEITAYKFRTINIQ